ncbi:hypothetical protein G647_02229 [Cladophialophora carrionii CBS 160.54]|uniref:Cytochrome b561 domain-containing protein n=1 Tax=Cladophialophora carrionii CBS 160.54 TaxID=1279043 RepID=V9DFM7_9EURO|nr:uncharacterized protein G647_02229 [Cladophialophora carrionii CBS 160.54]ETI25456.1 hypothetical protein G647_02229 [Cladophialophora carrionii CBS 160.54]
MATRPAMRALLLLSALQVTLVLAQTQYASPATPTVPIPGASSPWLTTTTTTTRPGATFGTINAPTQSAAHSSTIKSTSPSPFEDAKVAHAVIGAIAFLFIFPFGGIVIKVWPHRHIAWFHAAIQAFGLAMYLACLCLGLWMGSQLHTLHRYHALVGYVVLAMLVVQPLLKLHWFHTAIPRVAAFMPIHVWIGRVSLMLGIIDGGLGFRISSTLGGPPHWSQGWKVAYGIVGGIVWCVYVAVCLVWVDLKKKVLRAAPPSPGAPPEEIVVALALADQHVRDMSERYPKKTAAKTVVTAKAVDSDVESANTLPITPRRPSRAVVV